MPPRKNRKEVAPRVAETVSSDAVIGSASHGNFLTCMVTPKLTFSVPRQPQWKRVEDISQDELRSSFLHRFPTTISLDFSRLSFLPAVSPSTELTEETQMLVFKVVSEDVAEDRVMLKILQDFERGYESKVEESVAEAKREMYTETLSFQSLVDEVRKDQDKHAESTKIQNCELREQLQSIQKRLFLVEQEKDQLQKEQVQLKEMQRKGEVGQQEQISSLRAENQDLRNQVADMRLQIHDMLGVDDHCEIAASGSTAKVDATGGATAALEERVEQLTQQLGSLQAWLQQGSKLLEHTQVQLQGEASSEASSRGHSGRSRKKGKD